MEPPFQTFVIPFHQLVLTARGREREFQRQIADSIDIESIGFLLNDTLNGLFVFDLLRIRAVNIYDDTTTGITSVYDPVTIPTHYDTTNIGPKTTDHDEDDRIDDDDDNIHDESTTSTMSRSPTPSSSSSSSSSPKS